ncbi:uncharacterized protein [Branchiostoma lanceolatum]|uniref:uncharacterized protein n=1 Tax=Branchiostoma lanceolatum TaxID=7740 RepID=UPI003452E050
MEGTATSDPVPIQGKTKPELKRLTFQKKDRYENEWDDARPETPPTTYAAKGPLHYSKPRPSKFSHLAAQMETEETTTDPLARVQPTVVPLSRPVSRPAPKIPIQGKGLLKEAQDFQKNAGVSLAPDDLHKGVAGEVTKVQRIPGKIAQLTAENRSTSTESLPAGTPPKVTLTNSEKRHSWFGGMPEKKPACVPQTIYLPEQRRWFGLGPVYQPTQTVCVPVKPKVNLVDQVKQKGLSTKSKQFYHQDSDRDFFVDKNQQDFPKFKKICPRSDAEFNALAPSTL